MNCKFDPDISLETVRLMKEGLDKEGFSTPPHLMIQPVGFYTPDAGRLGYNSLPEAPFGIRIKLPISKSIFSFVVSIYFLTNVGERLSRYEAL